MRIGNHIRSNVVGYIALFAFAMSGTASALDGSDTVFSDDIVNGEVQSPDILDGTVGSADPRVATPATSQQAPIGRPPMGGYAASAYRAAGTPGRNSSFQRRVLEQQEAVVMPGHNAVDRAAVQFGSMGLNGEPDSLDVDEERYTSMDDMRR